MNRMIRASGNDVVLVAAHAPRTMPIDKATKRPCEGGSRDSADGATSAASASASGTRRASGATEVTVWIQTGPARKIEPCATSAAGRLWVALYTRQPSANNASPVATMSDT